MKKYGLQLRVPPAQKTSKPAPPRPPPPAFAFGGGDDEDDIEREISRQASKNKSLQKIEEQHKKAMEEDPSVFDYDGVYDEMKGQIARPKVQDRAERKGGAGVTSKYIEALMEKAKQREREHEVVYERKLLKERSKDDHLFADKEKFVTSAYKKKLAEQAKWLEEERLCQIREERDDVTKKSDLSDFYFGLGENVAFGAQSEDATKRKEQKPPGGTSAVAEHGPTEKNVQTDYTRDTEKDDTQANTEQSAELTTSDVTVKDKDDGDKLAAVDHSSERYKRSDDALASARERFLARKRARQQL
ncbi:coiled-coil domain-containing protein 55 [Musa troglodytarum]|uniref:Coiled-coil domain-containing protein 55 n=1 Tax=Musa troglodytarum TaxID=320322 RepID=A0A9E7KSG1_9LILI|nr:coiled-coil domain-containing protein 55 [Musa troglodytarum]